ncbi:hypothetical protein OHT52_10140 [Streptomyces sp. NBC_00247]|nr:hypothetical protein [Streptomyces sp. NBC_00247]
MARIIDEHGSGAVNRYFESQMPDASGWSEGDGGMGTIGDLDDPALG